MTNLRKSFILLSAAITMGNLREAQAAAKKAGQTRAGSGGAEQANKPARTGKKPRAGRPIANAA
jgi:hypothetical protein